MFKLLPYYLLIYGTEVHVYNIYTYFYVCILYMYMYTCNDMKENLESLKVSVNGFSPMRLRERERERE